MRVVLSIIYGRNMNFMETSLFVRISGSRVIASTNLKSNVGYVILYLTEIMEICCVWYHKKCSMIY